MMMRRWIHLAILLMGVPFFVSSVPFTTGCDQEYRFFFKTQHDQVFWVGENTYGECGQSHLIQIFAGDKRVEAKKMEMSRFNAWQWVEEAKKHFDYEQPLELIPKDNVIEFTSLSLKIRNPVYNARLMNMLNEQFTDDCARQWNQAMGVAGIDLPRISGVKAELLYYNLDGLYFNYDLDRAYVFPESNLLLLFTKHSERCAGGDTMHGFMIFRVKAI